MVWRGGGLGAVAGGGGVARATGGRATGATGHPPRALPPEGRRGEEGRAAGGCRGPVRCSGRSRCPGCVWGGRTSPPAPLSGPKGSSWAEREPLSAPEGGWRQPPDLSPPTLRTFSTETRRRRGAEPPLPCPKKLCQVQLQTNNSESAGTDAFPYLRYPKRVGPKLPKFSFVLRKKNTFSSGLATREVPPCLPTSPLLRPRADSPHIQPSASTGCAVPGNHRVHCVYNGQRSVYNVQRPPGNYNASVLTAATVLLHCKHPLQTCHERLHFF